MRYWLGTAIWILALGATVWAADEPPKPFPDMGREVGLILRSEYVDTDRMQPELILRRGLQALEGADVAIDARLTGTALEIKMGPTIESLPLSRMPASLEGALAILDRVAAVLPQGPFDPERVRKLTYTMLNGAIGTLDPHTVILPPEPADDFAEEIKGEFFGIGAYLTQEDGVVRIDRVMVDMPASLAGVQDGDVILEVNEEKIVGLSLSQVVKRIKGPRETVVTLKVERDGHDEPLDIPVTRDRVPFITMRSFVHAGDIGYLRMDEFNQHTALDLFRSLRRLQIDASGKPRALRGFVLDLRFNSGGLLQQARLISDFFLEHSKEIVRTVSMQPDSKPSAYHSSKQVYLDAPMVVLTSPGSASAAEILSGALQLNDRAVVMGKNTFGKGSVQVIRELLDGSNFKYTTQVYQLRDGASIQGRGVKPDIEMVEHRVLEDGAIDLFAYSPHAEAENEFAIVAPDTYLQTSKAKLHWLREWRTAEQMRTHALSARSFRPDQQAMVALELLDAALTPQGVQRMKVARETGEQRLVLDELLVPVVEARQVIEDADLTKALSEGPDGLTWGGEAMVAKGQITAAFTGPAAITAGETIELQFTIANTGSADVGRLYGMVAADDGSPFWEDELLIGALEAGASVERTLSFAVPPRVFAGPERFDLQIFRHGVDEPVATCPVELQLVAKPRPRIDYRWELLKEKNQDGIIALDEPVTVRLRLINSGDGDLPEGMLLVYKDDDHHLQLGEGRFRLPAIPSGGEQSCDVPITILRTVKLGRNESTFEGETVTLQVRADETFDDGIDGRYRPSFFHALEIPVGKPFAAGAVAPPRVSLLKHRVDGDQLSLEAEVIDENLRYLSIFRNDEKVLLQDAGTLADGKLTTTVALEPGLNRVRILGTDADETNGLVVLRVWGPEPEPVKVDDSGAIAEAPVDDGDDDLP